MIVVMDRGYTLPPGVPTVRFDNPQTNTFGACGAQAPNAAQRQTLARRMNMQRMLGMFPELLVKEIIPMIDACSAPNRHEKTGYGRGFLWVLCTHIWLY